MEEWTLLDTGPRTASENVAIDDALLTCRNKDLIPNTLRFLQFKPHCVLVGFHQSVEQEIRLSYCRENEIGINRRITGGGAIYFDEPQLGWELIVNRGHPLIPKDVEKIYEILCRGAVKGLKRLGVDAAFRPKNDIEVNGRKISGTGGAFEGLAFLFQGTLLTDFDVDTMLRALRIPIEKLRDKEIESVRERVTCLKWELGEVPPMDVIKKAVMEGFREEFGVDFIPREMTSDEIEFIEKKRDYYTSTDWIYGVRRPPEQKQILSSVYKAPGGLIRTALTVDLPNKRIQYALITGDFFAYPKRLILDLENALKDHPLEVEKVEETIIRFFEQNEHQMPGVTTADVITAVSKAIEKVAYLEMGIPLEDVNRLFTVQGTAKDVLDAGSPVLLLPYCAKLKDCEYRFKEGCIKCGKCTVSDAFELAEEFGIEPITIQNFEHLQETLRGLKERGVPAYVGSCCEAFFAKHMQDFEETGIPGLLIDIDSQTCYDLGKATVAKKGKFENQTHLRKDLIRMIIEMMNGDAQ